MRVSFKAHVTVRWAGRRSKTGQNSVVWFLNACSPWTNLWKEYLMLFAIFFAPKNSAVQFKSRVMMPSNISLRNKVASPNRWILINTVNVKWSNLTKQLAEILIFQSVNFDYFVVTNDHSLVTFNYSISHLQLTIKNSQIWLKFSGWNFNIH